MLNGLNLHVGQYLDIKPCSYHDMLMNPKALLAAELTGHVNLR